MMPYIKEDLKDERKLVQDIQRTIILFKYIKYWGMPDFRIISRKDEDEIEIYSFPPINNSGIHRFATIGVSEIYNLEQNLTNINDYEFVMILPRCLGGASDIEVMSFMMDIVAYFRELKIPLNEGTIIPETPLAPQTWKPRAILIDTPRGEAEELENHQVGSHVINLYWLVPVYKNEYDLIKERGLNEFDHLCEQSDLSPADVNRSSFILS
jgi:Suppressor of fused protein (SUFU)